MSRHALRPSLAGRVARPLVVTLAVAGAGSVVVGGLDLTADESATDPTTGSATELAAAGPVAGTLPVSAPAPALPAPGLADPAALPGPVPAEPVALVTPGGGSAGGSTGTTASRSGSAGTAGTAGTVGSSIPVERATAIPIVAAPPSPSPSSPSRSTMSFGNRTASPGAVRTTGHSTGGTPAAAPAPKRDTAPAPSSARTADDSGGSSSGGATRGAGDDGGALLTVGTPVGSLSVLSFD